MNLSEKKICFIRSSWHEKILINFESQFISSWKKAGGNEENIEIIITPGVLEIPLQALLKAKTKKYDAIVVSGLIADEQIYRHEFVAQAVIEHCMNVQMKYEIPLIHSIMTPHRFLSSAGDSGFFENHFICKAEEACDALVMTLQNMENNTML